MLQVVIVKFRTYTPDAANANISAAEPEANNQAYPSHRFYLPRSKTGIKPIYKRIFNPHRGIKTTGYTWKSSVTHSGYDASQGPVTFTGQPIINLENVLL